jgi:hypothetical protein
MGRATAVFAECHMKKSPPSLAESLAGSFATSLIILAAIMVFALVASALAQPAPATAAAGATPPGATAQPAKPAAPSHAHAARAPDKAGPAKFPSAIAANYAKDPAGKARRETCLDQYKVNKSTGDNGGLKWIQKGGGYYSVCLRKLKG